MVFITIKFNFSIESCVTRIYNDYTQRAVPEYHRTDTSKMAPKIELLTISPLLAHNSYWIDIILLGESRFLSLNF